MRETQVRSLGQKDPLEKGMATQSNILALRCYLLSGVVMYCVNLTQLGLHFPGSLFCLILCQGWSQEKFVRDLEGEHEAAANLML